MPISYSVLKGDELILNGHDATDVFQELLTAQGKSYELGLMLQVPPHEVEKLHSMYPEPRKRLLYTIISFLQRTEPRPTWRVIVEALKSPIVGLPVLAGRVEVAHFPDTTATCDVVPQITGMSLISTYICLV